MLPSLFGMKHAFLFLTAVARLGLAQAPIGARAVRDTDDTWWVHVRNSQGAEGWLKADDASTSGSGKDDLPCKQE